MLKTSSIAVSAGMLLCACAYTSEPLSTPALNVYSSYAEKVPGTYLLYVEADEFDKELKFRGFECSAHRYPISLQAGFKGSVVKTFENLTDSIQLVDRAPSRNELHSMGADGLIIVRGEEVSGRMTHHSGFWKNKGEAIIEVQASLTVDGENGRLLGTSVEGDGNDIVSLGMFCGGAEKAVTVASEDALKETMTRLGEAFSNSDRVRQELIRQRTSESTVMSAVSIEPSVK